MWKEVTLIAILMLKRLVLPHEALSTFRLKPIEAFVAPVSPRIVGGDEVVPHSVPFQAAVHINYMSYCGGALISPSYVLTAGHCGAVIVVADVILGAHNLSDPNEESQVTIRVSQTIVHEEYGSINLHNDIALLVLQEPAPINSFIQIAPLPSRNDVDVSYFDLTVTVTGWGLTKDVPFPSTIYMSDVLLGVDVPVSSLAECKEYYNDDEEEYVYDTNLCTSGYRNRGSCNGDSGGPLIYNGILIGVTSFGTTQCEMCSPSVYTRTSSYLDWIAQNSDVIMG